MLTQNLGYPRIGRQRQLKKACEQFWAGKIDVTELNSITSHVNLLQTKSHWPFATKCCFGKSKYWYHSAAIREGLPLRKAKRPHYLDWAVQAFRITASGV